MDAKEKKQRLVKLAPAIKEILAKKFTIDAQMSNAISLLVDKLVEKGWAVPDPETWTLGLQFLDEAKRDTKSCRLLYSKKAYAHAVYHLQQSVEKAVKGYVLIEGFYNANEIKEIVTHESPLVIIKALTEKTGMKYDAVKRNDKETLSKIRDAELIMSNEEKRMDMAKIGTPAILAALNDIEGFHRLTDGIVKEINPKLKTEGLRSLSDLDIRKFNVPTDLLVLALLTFPHWSYSRYPGGRITPVDYTLRFGVVRECKKISLILEKETNTLGLSAKSQQALL
jgi:HEPN domain-containing protein